MFRQYDHPQGVYIVPCYRYVEMLLWQHAATATSQHNDVNH